LTNKQHLDDAFALVRLLPPAGVEPLPEQRAAYVASIRTADNLVAKQLRVWIAALSSTQPVEKTFLDYDNNVAKNSGGKKGKKSVAMGKAPQLDLTTAKVQLSRTTAEVAREQLAAVNAREKTDVKKLQAKRHVREATEVMLAKVEATEPELKTARRAASAKRKPFVTPRGGVSEAENERLQNLERHYNSDQFRPPRKKMARLIQEGRDIDVDICFTCFPSELCLRRESKKGAPGKMFACQKCLKQFHAKCLVEAGILEKSATKGVGVAFDCPDCAGAPVG
jgi:hypothetical protein